MNIVSDSDIDSRVFPIGDKNVTSMGDVSFVGFYANNFFWATIKYFPEKAQKWPIPDPEKAQKWPNPDPEKAKMGVRSFMEIGTRVLRLPDWRKHLTLT